MPSPAPEVVRNALAQMLLASSDTPVVAVNGARQVGKSTLARQFQAQAGGQFITLDDDAQREAAIGDPRAFLERTIEGPLIIDEVQLAPPLFRALKAAVDRDRRPGRFVVTGSTRLLSAKGFADAMVGRLEVVELWPFSQGELGGVDDRFVTRAFGTTDAWTTSSFTRQHYVEIIVRGGFPEVVRRSPRRRGGWFDSYLETLTQELSRDLSGIERAAEIPRVIRLCAARTSDEFVAMEIRKQLSQGANPVTMWHYRDRDGAEVDLLLEHADGRVVGIEVTAASTVSGRDTKGLRLLAERLGERFHAGFVLSTMPEPIALGQRITALPISTLWE